MSIDEQAGQAEVSVEPVPVGTSPHVAYESHGQEVQQDQDLALDGGEADAGEADGGDDAYEDVQYGGKSYRLPKELKDALLRHDDYTRKTQELAEQRRTLEANTAQSQQVQALSAENQQDYTAYIALQTQLASYANLDWDRFSEDDPVQAQRAYIKYGQLKDQISQVAARMQYRQQALETVHRADRDKHIQQGRAVLEKEIPGWSGQLANSLVSYAVSQGVEEHEVRGTINPAHIKLINKARLYDEIIAKAKRSGNQAPAPTPVPIVAGRAKSAPKPEKMGIDQWMKWRAKDLVR